MAYTEDFIEQTILYVLNNDGSMNVSALLAKVERIHQFSLGQTEITAAFWRLCNKDKITFGPNYTVTLKEKQHVR